MKRFLLTISACICFVLSYAQSESSDVLSKTQITFAKNKDVPIVKDDNDNLGKIVELLRRNPDLKLIVEVYSCGRESEEHNQDLAQRRANNVRQLFIDKGLSPVQVETVSLADDTQNGKIDKTSKDCDCAVFRVLKR